MVKKAVQKMKNDQEKAARKQLLEDLFYDLGRNKAEIYKLNFFRGIFFGLGSVLGGTIVVAIVVYILAIVAQHFPPLQDTLNGINQTIESR